MVSQNGAVELEVFIESGCLSCERAVRLAKDVDTNYPELSVRVIDIGGDTARPEEVFAVPTFMLNGRVVSLGNPPASDLCSEIEALLEPAD